MATGKKSTAGKSAPAEGERMTGQTVAARRAAELRLRTIAEKFAPEHLRAISAMRRVLQKRLPKAFEVVYEYASWFVISYSPSEHGYEGVLALRANSEGVRLYFTHGRQCPIPANYCRAPVKRGG